MVGLDANVELSVFVLLSCLKRPCHMMETTVADQTRRLVDLDFKSVMRLVTFRHGNLFRYVSLQSS